MIINLISGPRNISTALMYSFAQRDDTKVIDEPFYACYLQTTGLDHPGRKEILESMPTSEASVLKQIQAKEKKHAVLFLKNMAHHHEGIKWDYLLTTKNILLIRNPKQLIASFAQVIDQPTIQDIGLKHEAELLDFLLKHNQPPIVLDSIDVLADPKKTLNSLCEKLGIPFTGKMLSWPKGPIPEDGIWAKYWYANVHQSTGFQKQKTSSRPLPAKCQKLYEEALPYYQKLKQYA